MKQIFWVILGGLIAVAAQAASSSTTINESSKSMAKSIQEPIMVRIPSKSYELGKYEVTQKQWRDIMGSNPSKFRNCGDDCPVENVKWNEVKTFISKLNKITGKTYRLPSEEEWVYACYGGRQTKYCGSNNINDVAWFEGNSSGHTHHVGKKQPNGYGLYDMSGNVFEWLEDSYGVDLNARKFRGGSWYYEIDDMNLSISYDWGWGESARDRGCGFRLARTLTTSN